MKKTIDMVIDIFVWILVFATIVSLILTIFTTYQYIFQGSFNKFLQRFFNKYTVFIWCLFFTMVTMGLKMLRDKTSPRNIIYSAICLLISIISMLFTFILKVNV